MLNLLKKIKEGRAMAEKTTKLAKREKSDLATREQTREESYFVKPAVDIYETDEGLHVVADLPGVGGEGVNVSVEEGILTLEARPEWNEPDNPFFREFRMTGFFRQFQLPQEVDQDKITADLKDGVLHLFLPKTEQAQPRKIAVKVK